MLLVAVQQRNQISADTSFRVVMGKQNQWALRVDSGDGDASS